MFIDTHAHLNFNAFKDDYNDAIKRAFDVGVKSIISVGSNLPTSLEAMRIAHEFSQNANEHESAGRQTPIANSQSASTGGSQIANGNIYAAVGLHPIHVRDEEFNFNKYLLLAKDSSVVAIGETGVDLYHDKTTIDIQRDVFEKLLRIANQVRKPVILHCREGEEDMRAWLIGERNLPEGVFHCFAGDMDFANFVLDLGFLISFTGIITFTKNPKTLEVIKSVPLDKIMIETDCPYLAPEPYRGKRNEPANVIEVAKKIAEIKNIPLSEVEKQTTANAIKLFKLK